MSSLIMYFPYVNDDSKAMFKAGLVVFKQKVTWLILKDPACMPIDGKEASLAYAAKRIDSWRTDIQVSHDGDGDHYKSLCFAPKSEEGGDPL